MRAHTSLSPPPPSNSLIAITFIRRLKFLINSYVCLFKMEFVLDFCFILMYDRLILFHFIYIFENSYFLSYRLLSGIIWKAGKISIWTRLYFFKKFDISFAYYMYLFCFYSIVFMIYFIILKYIIRNIYNELFTININSFVLMIYILFSCI